MSNTSLAIRSQVESPEFKLAVARALPKHLTADRFLRVSLTALTRTPKLAECDKHSFFNALLTLSQLGIEPDGRRAYLIPFENRKRGITECQLIVSYMGLIELAMRSGLVSSLHADVVCENDEFEYDRGRIKTHKIDFRRERGEVYAVYSIAHMKDGSEQCAVMSRGEVEAIRGRSRSANSGPWMTDWNEMAKKGLALDTPIPTPDGWSTMKDITVGHRVFDMHGKPTLVIAKSDVKRIPCFRVNFTNGDSIVCDDEHRWLARAGGSNANKFKHRVMTVNEIFDAIADGQSVTIPVQEPLEVCGQDLPIDPYLLGYWLGDGSAKASAITCGKDDLEHVQNMVKSSSYKLGKVWKDKRSDTFTVRIKGGMLQSLKSLNLIDNKHVPDMYMRASKENRLSLLQGLMDSDGHLDKDRGRAHFYNTNERLSNAVYELVCSLGDVPHSAVKTMSGFGVTCRAHFVGWKPTICPVKLARKIANFQPRKISKYRAIASVESIDSVPTQCIAVESESKTYLAGKSMAVTHNTSFRRLAKWLTLSPEFRDAISKDEEADVIEVEEAQELAPQPPKRKSLPRFDAKPSVEAAQPPEEQAPPEVVYDPNTASAPATQPANMSGCISSLSKSTIKAGFTFEDLMEVLAGHPKYATRVTEIKQWTDITDDEAKEIIGIVDVSNGQLKLKAPRRQAAPAPTTEGQL